MMNSNPVLRLGLAALALLLSTVPSAAQSSQPSRTLVATYPGAVTQINQQYALTLQAGTYAVVNRATLAVDPISTPAASIERIVLTPFGAILWTKQASPFATSTDIFEWRAGSPGSLVPLGTIARTAISCGGFTCPFREATSFRLAGNWALWREGVPEATTTATRRHLLTNTSVSLTSARFSGLIDNGDVFGFQDAGSVSTLVRWRDGVVTPLATNQQLLGEDISTDGTTFAYVAGEAGPVGSDSACFRTWVTTPPGGSESLSLPNCTVTEGGFRPLRPRPGADYVVDHGRVFYKQQLQSAENMLWRRDSNGSRHNLNVLGDLVSIGPGGDFVYATTVATGPSQTGDILFYRSAGPEPPVDLHPIQGSGVQWADNAWNIFDNASLYHLVLPTFAPSVLAEGATGTFFETDVAILNPTNAPAAAQVSFLKEGGSRVDQAQTIPAHSRVTIHLNDQTGLGATAAATLVEPTNGAPLVVERTMTWDATGYGGHSGSAADGARTGWYFAEGAQGYFDTFLLLVNPNAYDADVTLKFLREGATPFYLRRTLPAGARVTIHSGGIPELVNRSFATMVTSSLPIVAERAMYFGATPFWTGGHESAGAPMASTRWFHAEGTTGELFDTFILLANVNSEPAHVQVRFLSDSGWVIAQTYTMAGNTRLTIPVETVDFLLAHASFATTVESDVPIVSERAMYWSLSGGSWDEAHNSFGLTTTATKWATSDGRAGGPRNYQTYVLVANPSTTQTANLTATFMREDGAQAVRTFTLAPNRRLTIPCGDVPELANANFGVVVESTNAVPIAVERATYWDANGVTWAGGTNVTATPIP